MIEVVACNDIVDSAVKESTVAVYYFIATIKQFH